MRKNVFDRWIGSKLAARAEGREIVAKPQSVYGRRAVSLCVSRPSMYVRRFGGKVHKDINGYKVLYSRFREPLAFVGDVVGLLAIVGTAWLAWVII